MPGRVGGLSTSRMCGGTPTPALPRTREREKQKGAGMMQFSFSNHVLDIGLRELTRGGESIAVEPQVFDLLIYLLENRERVVSKDDLIENIWAGRIVSESTLTSRINAARKAVGDSGKDQSVIRTIARKGFRFVGDVQKATEPHASPNAITPRTEWPQSPSPAPAPAAELP